MISPDRITFYTSLLEGMPFEEVASLFERGEEKELKAGEIYIAQGEMTMKLAYIQAGLLRAYGIKDNGEEATFLLRWEDQFIGAHDCIILQQPSKFIYHAIEDTILLELDYPVIDEIFHRNPRYEPLRHYVLLTMLGGTLQMLENFILLTPEERYRKLVAENAAILNRVPNKYIASLLGITPVSLSRIRKRISKK